MARSAPMRIRSKHRQAIQRMATARAEPLTETLHLALALGLRALARADGDARPMAASPSRPPARAP